MDSDPWADAPTTPKLPSEPGTPKSTKARISLESHASPSPQSPESPPSAGPKFSPEEPNSEAAPSSPTQPKVLAPPPPPTNTIEDGDDGFDDFDDFDDFDEPASAGANLGGPSPSDNIEGGEDDGFGDFGDFEEGEFEEASPEQLPDGSTASQQDVLGAGLVGEPFEEEERWRALSLRPFPPRGELIEQISTLLAPLVNANASGSGSEYLTDEQPRMVGGLSQILVAESSRNAYAQLTTAPMLKPLDWTRSRVRREHLISMGVPVNLDEVDSHRLSALPPLRITTGAALARPKRAETIDANGRYTSSQKGKGRDLSPNSGASYPGSGSVPTSATGRSPGSGKYGLGVKPEVDLAKAEEYCGLEEDRLSLLPIATLRRLQADLADTSAQASALLAWSLQFKDAQTQDSTTYNGMISELIANAAKVKSAQATGGGVFRRASAKRPQSVSGTVTPRRTGSPGMW